jgi:uncharacterized protein YecT (DUF1311 family)
MGTMTTSDVDDYAKGGAVLGVASLVLGIIAAVGAVGTTNTSPENNIIFAIFFQVLGFAFGLGSIFLCKKARGSALAGIILSVCAAVYVGVVLSLGPSASLSTSNESKSTSRTESQWTPSYDCQKIASGPERMVCSNKVLSNLDVQLNGEYSRAAKRVTDRAILKAEQLNWLKNVRNNCSDAVCMENAYRERLNQLKSQ